MFFFFEGGGKLVLLVKEGKATLATNGRLLVGRTAECSRRTINAGWTEGVVLLSFPQRRVLGIGRRFCTLRREQLEGSRGGPEVVGGMRGMMQMKTGRLRRCCDMI